MAKIYDFAEFKARRMALAQGISQMPDLNSASLAEDALRDLMRNGFTLTEDVRSVPLPPCEDMAAFTIALDDAIAQLNALKWPGKIEFPK